MKSSPFLIASCTVLGSILSSSVAHSGGVSPECGVFLPPSSQSSPDRDVQALAFCACAISAPLAEAENGQQNWYAPAVTEGRVILPGDGANGTFSVISLGVPAQTVGLFNLPRSGDRLAPGRSPYYFDEAKALQLTPFPRGENRIVAVEDPRAVKSPLSAPKNVALDDAFKTQTGASLTSILKFAEKTDGPELLHEIYPIPTANPEDLKKNLEEAELNATNAKRSVGQLVEALEASLETLNTDSITYSVKPKGSRKKPAYEIIQTVNGVPSRATQLESQYEERLKAIREAQQNATYQAQRLTELRNQMSRIDKSKDIEKCRAMGRESGQKDWGGFFKALEDQIALSIKAEQQASTATRNQSKTGRSGKSKRGR